MNTLAVVVVGIGVDNAQQFDVGGACDSFCLSNCDVVVVVERN